MRIISIINEKGGVGKTTCTMNIAAGLAMFRKKILLIDLDPQENLTNSLGMQGANLRKSIWHVINKNDCIENHIVTREPFDLVPGHSNLAAVQDKLGYIKKTDILRHSMHNLTGYDYVLIDCPANLGILSLNSLAASDEVYIILQSEFLALNGMAKLTKEIQKIKSDFNSNLIIGGVIANRFDKRKRLNNEVVDNMKEFFGNRFFETVIRENISLAESPSFGKTIFEFKPKSHGAEDFRKLCREIIRRDHNKPLPQREKIRLFDIAQENNGNK
jgi:chromosome partitioning protein